MKTIEELIQHIDFTPLEEGERRIHEVATVTKMRGQELMNLYNLAHLAAQKGRAAVATQLSAAETAMAALAAEIALVRAPAELKRLGVLSSRSPGGSEDQRSHVIAMDPEYLAMKAQVLALKDAVESFAIRAKSMERAFSAVKAIYLDRELPNPNTGNPVPRPAVPQGRGFGTPRY